VSPARCLLPGVSCPVSPARCLLPGVSCPVSPARCPLPGVSCTLSPVPCPLSRVPCPMFQVPSPMFQVLSPMFQVPSPVSSVPCPTLHPLSCAPVLSCPVSSLLCPRSHVLCLLYLSGLMGTSSCVNFAKLIPTDFCARKLSSLKTLIYHQKSQWITLEVIFIANGQLPALIPKDGRH
jgi:hypothetical protein